MEMTKRLLEMLSKLTPGELNILGSDMCDRINHTCEKDCNNCPIYDSENFSQLIAELDSIKE